MAGKEEIVSNEIQGCIKAAMSTELEVLEGNGCER